MVANFPVIGLILLFPALGVVYNVFLGYRDGRSAVNLVGPSVVFLAFICASIAFVRLLRMPPGSALQFSLWPWITAGSFHVDIAFRIDALSAVMALVVTGVGSLIHLYSAGYMAHDEDYARFFTYMNLFMFSML